MKKRSTGEINGFLDSTTVLNGELRFTDTMRIDGQVNGRVISENLLIVGETACVEADIDVGSITILGRVVGNLTASARVEILPGASLVGDVTTPVLRIDEGATFQGRVEMALDHPAEAEVVEAEVAAPLALLEGD